VATIVGSGNKWSYLQLGQIRTIMGQAMDREAACVTLFILRDTPDELSRDPFQPKLKLHSLGNKLGGVQAVNLTYSYRNAHKRSMIWLVVEGRRNCGLSLRGNDDEA